MRTILLYYSLLLSIVITVGSAVMALSSGNPVFFIVFLPVIAYFLLKVIRKTKGLRILLYYSFILITIMALMGFIGATSGPQFLSAIIFFPIALYFWLNILPKRNKKLPLPTKALSVVLKEKDKITSKIIKGRIVPDTPKGYDRDRRIFLKFIGSAGFILFLFSIFTTKAHGAFFGSVPGPGTVALKDTAGVQIDPSQHHPTDGYKISQLDDSTPAFYGFVRKDGAWFIMKEDSAGNYRYVRGASLFATNWTNRATLTYDYFDIIF